MGLAGNADPVQFELNRHLNIFWGLNGSGKTSMLKILHSALSNNAGILAKVPFTEATVDFYSENHEATYRRTFAKADLGRGEQLALNQVYYAAVERGDVEWTIGTERANWKTTRLRGLTGAKRSPQERRRLPDRMKHGYLPISRVVDLPVEIRRQTGSTSTSIDDDYLDVLFARQLRLRWQVYKSEALDRIQLLQQRGIGEILSILFGDKRTPGRQVSTTKLTADEAFDLVSLFLRNQGIHVRFDKKSFESQYDDDPKIRQVIACIEEVNEDRKLALKPQQELKAVIERLYGGNKTLELSGRDGIGVYLDEGETRIPIEQLSSGERQLLRILLETMIAETSTVLIDEPELSMHVDWQRVLVDSMRLVNPECQMILATHSPEVMALVPDENIFEL